MRFQLFNAAAAFMLLGIASAQCNCVHNGDAGRWEDSLDPASRLGDLCKKGGGCHQATKGRMCVSGDLGKCTCAVDSAKAWQSWNQDWWLWSAITCDGLSITIT